MPPFSLTTYAPFPNHLAIDSHRPNIDIPMSNNPRIALYREAMSLEEKRASLQAELDRLTSRLSSVQSQLFGSKAAAAAAFAGPRVVLVAPRGRRRRSRRGELKAQVLEALSAAGGKGVRVKDVAAAIGTKPANIYAWFQTATKRIPQIKKIGEAHYRLEGSVPTAASKAPAAKPGRRGRRSTRPLSKRGELAARILGALKSAGKQGMKVRDLADKLNVKYKNLFIWFATTGKKNKGIKKVGEAHYRLDV